MESLAVQQLFRDVEDEEAWIREKEPIIASTNRGKDLIGVQNLIKKHQAMQAEINNHEPRIDAVSQVRDVAESGSSSRCSSSPSFRNGRHHFNGFCSLSVSDCPAHG